MKKYTFRCGALFQPFLGSCQHDPTRYQFNFSVGLVCKLLTPYLGDPGYKKSRQTLFHCNTPNLRQVNCHNVICLTNHRMSRIMPAFRLSQTCSQVLHTVLVLCFNLSRSAANLNSSPNLLGKVRHKPWDLALIVSISQ